MTAPDDSSAVEAVALALAIDDWTGGDNTQVWLWDCLDELERYAMFRAQLPAARVAVTAIAAAA